MSSEHRFAGHVPDVTGSTMPIFRAAATIFLLSTLSLAGCKIIKTPTAEEASAAAATATNNPDRMVADLWDTKVIPYLDTRAGAFNDVLALSVSDVEAAGAKYGHREKQGNPPWTLAAKVDGKVLAAETASRAGSVDVDTNGDGKADVRVQIGAAVKGNAIRDSLDFVGFNQFKNQIEWAQFGKSFNAHLNSTVLAKLPRDKLVGSRIQALGVFPVGAAGQLPLLTPVRITLEPGT